MGLSAIVSLVHPHLPALPPGHATALWLDQCQHQQLTGCSIKVGRRWESLEEEGRREGALPLKEALKEIGKKDRRLIFIIITTNKLGIEGKGIIEENC